MFGENMPGSISQLQQPLETHIICCKQLVLFSDSLKTWKLAPYIKAPLPPTPASSPSARTTTAGCVRYFCAKFPSLDAAIIVTGFTTNVLLSGILEEIVPPIVNKRLSHIIEIMKELSVGS
jgi:hypothetical protein